MKIAINASYLSRPANGIGQVTNHVLNGMARLSAPGGASLEFYLYLENEVDWNFPPGFHKRIVPLPGRPGRTVPRLRWETHSLPGAIRRDGCDALISLYQSATVVPRGCPHVMVVHDVIWKVYPWLLDTWMKRIHARLLDRGIRRASHRVAVSEYTRQDLTKRIGINPESVIVLHDAVDPLFAMPVAEKDLARVLQRHQLSPGYIYHGGGLHERKNAKTVLEAYRRLQEQNRTKSFVKQLPRLVISGLYRPGAKFITDVEGLARKLGISSEVTLLGEISQGELPAIYRGASMFIYPSLYEGFGMPMLEAMHQGVPVIAANTSSLPEVGGEADPYCNPSNPDEFASAMRKLLTNPETCATLSEAGKLRAASFSWTPFVDGLLNLTMSSVQGEPQRR